jgi:hypothetical protein
MKSVAFSLTGENIMSSYIVSVGSNKELVVRARSADHANEKAELRLLLKGDRTNPVLPHLTRRVTELEAFAAQVTGYLDDITEEVEDLFDEVGGDYAW